ncbi:MAG: histidine ammonia-lyase [Bacteroidetes bacterium]|nr:MAG: histidine ammonia-lyase [Bacteroidota bacterium]
MAKLKIQISDKTIGYDLIDKLVNADCHVSLSKSTEKKIVASRKFLDKKIKSSKAPIYGVTTGFGSLYDQSISGHDLEKLQHNLVVSHAVGMGEEVPSEIVKLMLVLKAQSLSYGYSGVALSTVKRLLDFYNKDIVPVVYQQGSLGASGDLAPLAHMSLPVLGLGEVYYKGVKQQTSTLFKKLKLKPLKLKSKEGVALLNGTQFMSAYGTFSVNKARKLFELADLIASISLDAFDCGLGPFDASIQAVRPHAGQISTAANIRKILRGSKISSRKKNHVQDPYSFRCIPQVHGASKDALDHIANVFQTEINSVTDNPTIFIKEDKIISAGNFHGQPLAINLDYLCIAMAEMCSISERRVYKLVSGKRGLPTYLIANPGLNSGFMMTQYLAASIVSQNKQLCTPASVDTIDSSNGQEDHVSMGANAATKAYRVLQNMETVLAIELFNAAQALNFRKPLKSSALIEQFVAKYRKRVAVIKNDKVLRKEILATVDFLRKEY